MVPVRPGRNIPIIVETAALNQRLKKLGIFTARDLDRNIQENLKREKNSRMTEREVVVNKRRRRARAPGHDDRQRGDEISL